METQEMRAKYLSAVASFPFDDYDSFSKLCVDFCKSTKMDYWDLAYCEYLLKLSPGTKFQVIPMDGEVKEYRKTWENGISELALYDPPIHIGDLSLRVGIWKDNCRLIDCYQLIKTCDTCGSDIVSGKCFGIATIGWEITNDFDNHHCPIDVRDRLVKSAVNRFVKE